jgi:hypothetical protein
MPQFLMRLWLLGIGAIGLLSAGSDKPELTTKVKLAEYNCQFSPYTSTPLLFVNYKIENSNSFRLFDLGLHYEVEWLGKDGQEAQKKNGTVTVTDVPPNDTKADRVKVGEFAGEKADYKILGCKAWIGGFYKEVAVPKKRTVTVKTGEEVKVAPDCKDDYAKLQTMKPGVEKREFAAKMARLGCLSMEPTYGKKTEDYKQVERVWVEHTKSSQE